jgi:hypothetical protein
VQQNGEFPVRLSSTTSGIFGRDRTLLLAYTVQLGTCAGVVTGEGGAPELILCPRLCLWGYADMTPTQGVCPIQPSACASKSEGQTST